MEDLFSQLFRFIAKDINSEYCGWIKTYLAATVDKKLVVPIFDIVSNAQFLYVSSLKYRYFETKSQI
ncbi:hypothetical protein DSB67_11080 [Vibrio campbellii]|nr:hypothetical protein DSB67_11080 [Vibrio campbellii]